ncbi:hypothetical protein QYF61_018271 [Mycteria americana]|uniref:Uncharacterized protein n=1 Tax=Mycteria americana TaxID=33587 RepID=A0AAN7MPI5_MYCAM|nr:hypothetical protein QYF61_018271 [Mycteria americana]
MVTNGRSDHISVKINGKPSLILSPIPPGRGVGEEEEEELINETETTRSLFLNELRGVQKDTSRRPGKHVVTWVPQCWDNGASGLELEVRKPSSWDPFPGKGALTK